MARATAHGRLAAVHKAGEEYGPEVGRLKMARDILEDAKKKYFKSVSTDVQQSFNNLHAVRLVLIICAIESMNL